MSGFGNQYGVFPLSGKAVILRDYCPAIAQMPNGSFPRIDHRFDGENHSREQCQSGSGVTIVQDLGLLVEFDAYAMAAVFSYDAIAMFLRMFLNGGADIPEPVSWFDLMDAVPHAFMADFA